MKKLIPAFALLLISAIVLSTSSFAWFSMNTTVSATGMQVQANTAASLVITNTSGSGYSNTAAAADTGVKSLSPVSTIDLTGWYTMSDATKVTGYTNGTPKDDAQFTAVSSGSGYYNSATFYVKLQAATTTNYNTLYVSAINVEGAPAKAISNALRVGVKCGEQVFIYAPFAASDIGNGGVGGSASTTTYDGIVAANSNYSLDATKDPCTITSIGSDDANLLASGTMLSNTVEQTIVVYIWYEGQDANCTSANSIESETLKVSIDFATMNKQ